LPALAALLALAVAPAARAQTDSDSTTPPRGAADSVSVRPASPDTVRVRPVSPGTIRVQQPRTKQLPRRSPSQHRHTMDVRIEEVRQDSVFAAFRAQLAGHDFDAARRSLETIRDGRSSALERQVAAFDRIELDFFAGDFDTALESYRSYAVSHKRGYLTNDAIARLFLIEDNSDHMRAPLRLFARSELHERNGRVDSAITVCEVVLERFPDSALRDDLHLQLGDLVLLTADPGAALAHYQAVTDSIADSPVAATAQMRIGRYYETVGRDLRAAVGAYERVLERYPDSLEAPEARKRLEGLRQRTSRS
jgi:tetratricopeptide (TPR) repeat protein